MHLPRHNALSLSALGLAAASLLALAGCASGSGGAAASTDGGATATGSPSGSSGPAAAESREPAALRHADLIAALGGGAERARQDLVGRNAELDLTRATGRGVPKGVHYRVEAGDNLLLRCLSTGPGFRGGNVNTEIRAVRVPSKGARVVDLARCENAPAPAPQAPRARAAEPEPAAASAGAGAVGAGKPGMDARGNVVDSSKVEAGSGRTVKGLNDYEGEITGNPARGSKFTRLQIGMPMKQVMDLAGQPTDQGAYITGKAWIPFYFGGDKHRHELVYKGQGRLIFAGGGLGDYTSGHLIWIIHNANERGYR